MEVNSKFIDGANALAITTIDAKSIEDKKKSIAQKSAKTMKVDGFRKGKVPVNVVLSRYAKELQTDAMQDLYKEIIDKALQSLEKKQEDLIGDPIFSKHDEKDGNIDIEMELSFKPKIDISGYETAIPEYSTPKVTKKEIQAKIDEFLEGVAELKKSDKKTLENGDFAKFDFEGFVDNVAFEGGSAKDYILKIGSKQFIPGFEDGMIGMNIGDQKDIKVTFPKDYNATNLAGKEAVFKVTLHEIQEKDIQKEVTLELLQKAMPQDKDISVEKFEERIKERIKEDKFHELLNNELKNKFADNIIEKIKFDLPKNIVEQEIDMQFNSEWQSYTPQDMQKFRENKDELKKAREKYRDEAKKSVALTFIIDEIAKSRNIEATDQELMQNIYFEAYRHGIDPKAHFENYRKQGLLPAIKMAIIEEKLFNDLFSKEKKKTAPKNDKEDKENK